MFTACLSMFALSTTLEFQALVDRIRQQQDVPGVSVSVTYQDQVMFSGGSGLADIQQERIIDAETPLYIGSVSKVLTAVLALQLVEENKLELDSAVLNSGGKDLTLRQLLAHKSGIPREGPYGYWFNANFPEDQELERYLSALSLEFQPGTRTRYSNIAYAALGLAIARQRNLSFDELLNRHLFKPLGMNASAASGPVEDIAHGYTPPGRIIPSETMPFAGVGERVGDRFDRVYHRSGAMAPAFGIVSTASDMGRLTQFLLGYGATGVLGKEQLQSIPGESANGRGLGLRNETIGGRTLSHHGGWFAAHRSHLLLDYKNAIGVVVLTNADNGDAEQFAVALYEKAVQLLE